MSLRMQMVPRATGLCQTLQRLSAAAWATLADGHKYDMAIGEETLTDMLLLELKRAHPAEVKIQKFTRRGEAVSGADWEWWFEGPSWLGMRVQAKRLYPRSMRYESLLDAVGKSKKLQGDVLMAASRKARLFPAYCFYNFWDTTKLQVQHVPLNCRTFGAAEHVLGCTFASASQIHHRLSKNSKDDFTSVMQLAFPWVCLACCPGALSSRQSLADLVKGALDLQLDRVASVPAADAMRRTRDVRPHLTGPDEVPRYVISILHGDPPQAVPGGVAGVVVFKQGSRS